MSSLLRPELLDGLAQNWMKFGIHVPVMVNCNNSDGVMFHLVPSSSHCVHYFGLMPAELMTPP